MSRSANRKKFVAIVALFLVPLIASFVVYKTLPEGYRPDSMANNGELLQPIHTLTAFNQLTTQGQSFGNKQIEKKWTLVHIISSTCEEDCSKMLYNTRQTRLLLSKNIDRVQRVAVLTDATQHSTMDRMWESHPDLTVLLGLPDGMGSQILEVVAGAKSRPYSVFLIDPLGNVMMEFPQSLDSKLVLKDLKKLLKLSHIG